MKQTQADNIGYVPAGENKSSDEPPLKTKLYIKNMVSARCKQLIRELLAELGIPFLTVELGEVILNEAVAEKKRKELAGCLLQSGFALVEDHKSVMVEKIKAVVIEMVHYTDKFPNIKHSVYISQKLNYNYHYLANLFSEWKGITLEQFIILHKIEKVKELILHGEYKLTEIARKLNYSSSAHLSNQFKQVTGLSPSLFKKLEVNGRQPLENL